MRAIRRLLFGRRSFMKIMALAAVCVFTLGLYTEVTFTTSWTLRRKCNGSDGVTDPNGVSSNSRSANKNESSTRMYESVRYKRFLRLKKMGLQNATENFDIFQNPIPDVGDIGDPLIPTPSLEIFKFSKNFSLFQNMKEMYQNQGVYEGKVTPLTFRTRENSTALQDEKLNNAFMGFKISGNTKIRGEENIDRVIHGQGHLDLNTTLGPVHASRNPVAPQGQGSEEVKGPQGYDHLKVDTGGTMSRLHGNSESVPSQRLTEIKANQDRLMPNGSTNIHTSKETGSIADRKRILEIQGHLKDNVTGTDLKKEGNNGLSKDHEITEVKDTHTGNKVAGTIDIQGPVKVISTKVTQSPVIVSNIKITEGSVKVKHAKVTQGSVKVNITKVIQSPMKVNDIKLIQEPVNVIGGKDIQGHAKVNNTITTQKSVGKPESAQGHKTQELSHSQGRLNASIPIFDQKGNAGPVHSIITQVKDTKGQLNPVTTTMTYDRNLVVHCKESPYIFCSPPPKPGNQTRMYHVVALRRPGWMGRAAHRFDKCPYNQCVLDGESEAKITKNTDLVHVHAVALNFQSQTFHPPAKRWPHQLYATSTWESPVTTHAEFLHNSSSEWNHLFNVTITYRVDADVFVPYTMLEFQPLPVHKRPNYYEIAKKKTRTAFWVVSNCKAPSKRLEYAREMQKYVDIDIFGRCGKPCELSKKSPACVKEFPSAYKFYLSFENSLCTDYVTEKFFKAFTPDWDIIPVVRGRLDYGKYFSNWTFINAADFKSPKDLALHLKSLAADVETYSKYLEHKNLYRAVPGTKSSAVACKLCEYLHTRDNKPKVYDMKKWMGDGHCIQPNDIV